ncbi:MAG: hypothetical protein ACE5JU_25535, partial [Candidatus Binatia bacterium]
SLFPYCPQAVEEHLKADSVDLHPGGDITERVLTSQPFPNRASNLGGCSEELGRSHYSLLAWLIGYATKIVAQLPQARRLWVAIAASRKNDCLD